MASPTYGYNPRKLGYGYQQPNQTQTPRISPLALAASGGTPTPTDPFGLQQRAGTGTFEGASPFPQPQAKNVTPPASAAGAIPNAASHPGGSSSAPSGPGAPVFDINTDPALQQAQSLLGMNDQQAQAQALRLKQQLLQQYGDPTLAAALLGANDPFVAAAGQNPTSTRAQLGQQHDRGLTDMTESFNKQNLGYSGARVKGEQQFAQDYQNALAQAAAGVNQGLGGIDSNLVAALSANNAQRVGAFQDAYGRHATDPGAVVPPDMGGAGGAGADAGGGAGGSDPFGAPGGGLGMDPRLRQIQLALASGRMS